MFLEFSKIVLQLNNGYSNNSCVTNYVTFRDKMIVEGSDYDVFFQRQVLKDLDRRVVNGIYIYLAVWMLIGAATDFYLAHPQLYWLISSALASFGLLRVFGYVYVAKSLQPNQTVQFVWHFVNMLLPSALYGVLLSLAIYSPAFEEMFFYLLISIFAFISTGSMGYAPIKSFSLIFVAALTILPLLTAFFVSDEQLIIGLLLILYSSYMMLQATRMNKEYLLLIQQQFELKQLNLQDSLTGIANRRHFEDSISSAWNSGNRSQNQLVLVLVDVDYFKRINDTFGHAAGDQVLKEIANIVHFACKREGEFAARIGGEEFALLVRSNEDDNVELLIEKIRQKIESEEIIVDNQIIKVTCSFGIAITKPSLDKTISEFYKVADKCLYAAKDSGRNQIVSGKY